MALLVTGIRADDHDARVATYHLAVVTDRLDARLNLHCFLLPGRSLVAVDDAAPVEVVGAELDDHAVLGKDADVVLAHLPGDVREHLVPVVELDPEARIRKRLRDRSLDLDHAVLLRHASPISRPGGPAAEFRILWSCAPDRSKRARWSARAAPERAVLVPDQRTDPGFSATGRHIDWRWQRTHAEHTRSTSLHADLGHREGAGDDAGDRKSTRLNSSHVAISYAVFCLKKKKRPSHTPSELA